MEQKEIVGKAVYVLQSVGCNGVISLQGYNAAFGTSAHCAAHIGCGCRSADGWQQKSAQGGQRCFHCVDECFELRYILGCHRRAACLLCVGKKGAYGEEFLLHLGKKALLTGAQFAGIGLQQGYARAQLVDGAVGLYDTENNLVLVMKK